MINRLITKLISALRLVQLTNVISFKSLVSLKRQSRYSSGTINTKIGKISYVDPASALSGLKEIFVDEIYQSKMKPSDKPVVVDCGANIGLSALYFAKEYNAKVYAFEADPEIARILSENIKANNLEGKIKVENKAVWIDDSGVLFDVEGAYSGQIHQHGHDLVKESVQVPSISLHEIIPGLEKISFLKLDIEGAENQVLLNCQGLLNKIDYIFIEWHSVTLDSQYLGEILTLLKLEGFRYHIKEAFTSTHPFSQVEEMCGMDLQLNIFAFRQECAE